MIIPKTNYKDLPILEYQPGHTPMQWGQAHGSAYKEAVRELVGIRRDMLRERFPTLEESRIEAEAQRQFKITQEYFPSLGEEIEGIRTGADVSLADIVILNNYTDFRDVFLTDQGCSTLAIQREGKKIAGQTWDMHGSATNFVCVLKVPPTDGRPAQTVFSLLGCTGMAGINSSGILVGVNNINTHGAESGVIWPVFVRKLLAQKKQSDVVTLLNEAKPSSGHNYLLAGPEGCEMREITPTLNETIGKLTKDEVGTITHTNHCLNEKLQAIEVKGNIPGTSLGRLRLVDELVTDVHSLDGLISLLHSHKEHPESICSHFDNGMKDPSITCGGIAADLDSGQFKIWRGCPEYGNQYSELISKIEVLSD